MSQVPAEALQTVVEGSKASAGQDPEVPVQVSAVSQVPAEARQVVPELSYWQVEEQQSPSAVLLSSHCSPDSTVPLPQTALGVQVFAPSQVPPVQAVPLAA